MEFDWGTAAQVVTAFVVALFGFIKAGGAMVRFFKGK